LIGEVHWVAFTRVPNTNWKIPDGTTVSRATYPALLASLIHSNSVTFTNGSANIGWTAHGLTAGDPVKFYTTGALLFRPVPGLDANRGFGADQLGALQGHFHSATGLNTNTAPVSNTTLNVTVSSPGGTGAVGVQRLTASTARPALRQDPTAQPSALAYYSGSLIDSYAW
jgi:hypothetical protein